MGATSKVVAALAPPPKSTEVRPSKNRLPDRVMVRKYVLPLVGLVTSRAEPSFEHFELGLLIYE